MHNDDNLSAVSTRTLDSIAIYNQMHNIQQLCNVYTLRIDDRTPTREVHFFKEEKQKKIKNFHSLDKKYCKIRIFWFRYD